MYRVIKAFNDNTVLAVRMENQKEYLLVGNGIGFGKKVSERFEAPEGCTVYSLNEETERGKALELVKAIDPVFLEISDELLKRSEKVFGRVDQRILFPMADHIAFAVQRIRANEQIKNPLTDDIRALFHMEYKVAESVRGMLKERLGVEINEHEIGYIALHIHAAIEEENVAMSMQIASAVRECVQMVEEVSGKKIDTMTLAYNRLMNHIRYMAARAISGESLKLNMNDYMSLKYPASYMMAKIVCEKLEKQLHKPLEDVEIGYLAMHIERVASGDIQ